MRHVNIIIIILVILFLLLICSCGIFGGLFYFRTSSVKVEDSNSSITGYVEYDDSYGIVCPTNVKFMQASDSPAIACQCPEGYIKKSEIIGYNSCSGQGSECPIMGVQCVPE